MQQRLGKIVSALFLFKTLVFGGAPLFVPDQLIVRFDDFMTQNEISLLLADLDAKAEHRISIPLNLWLVKVDLERVPLSQALNELNASYGVRYAQRDHMLSERNTPDDPMFGSQWNFDNQGQSGGTVDADIDAPEAWEISTGGMTILGREIVAGIVDGGCDMTHPDLLANFWSNPDEIPGNGLDDDENGWVDDSLGWNAFGHNANIPLSSHGTHVAGIVGAHSNNGNQVAGVNWDVKLMMVAGASTSTSIAMEAYSYILDQRLLWSESGGMHGAFVVSINSSFGIDYAFCDSSNYPVWNDMYNALGNLGILSVAATANRNVNVDQVGDVPTGCSSPFIIAVTNTNKYDEKAYAGYGPQSIDLGAPGSGILSTNYYGGTSTKTGTSMSAPHVTGAVALMHAAANLPLAQLYENDPSAGALLFKQLLLESVDPLESLDSITVTGGRLNLHQAVLSAATWEPGDGNLNDDAYVNIQDVILMTQLILGHIEPTTRMMAAGDLNGDRSVTVQDLVLLIQVILN